MILPFMASWSIVLCMKRVPLWVWAIIIGFVLTIIAIIAVLIIVLPGTTKMQSKQTVIESKSEEKDTTNEETVTRSQTKLIKDERCVDVSSSSLASMQSGLNLNIRETATLSIGQAVKSKDYSKVYFVAVEVDGKGYESKGDIALLTTNDLELTSIVYTVDEPSKELFVFLDGGSTDARISVNDDGAKEAINCLKQTLGL